LFLSNLQNYETYYFEILSLQLTSKDMTMKFLIKGGNNAEDKGNPNREKCAYRIFR